MGGGKGGAPGPQFGQGPFAQAAQSQGAQSHVGLQGPIGGSSWSQDPNGQWTQSNQFNGPLGQAAQGYQQQIAGQGALDLSGLPQIDQGQGVQQQAMNASYGQAKSRLDPQWGQAGEQLQSQLASQGLDPGTEAANNAQGNFDRAKTDAYQTAQNASVGQGLQAQQQAFGQSMGAQQQALSNMLTQRGMPAQQLQQLMGMLGGGQSAGAAQPANQLGAMQGQAGFNLDNQNMQNQAGGGFWNNILGAGASVLPMFFNKNVQQAGVQAGAGAALSDERAKQKIERLPIEVVDGVPLAVFEYRYAPGRKLLGVIAQDVLKVLPRLVHKRPDGLLCVDYGGLAWTR